jgi:hypothetical protein
MPSLWPERYSCYGNHLAVQKACQVYPVPSVLKMSFWYDMQAAYKQRLISRHAQGCDTDGKKLQICLHSSVKVL